MFLRQSHVSAQKRSSGQKPDRRTLKVAAACSPTVRSTIGDGGLNFSVRNGKSEPTDNEIYGLWTDTVSVKPMGRNVSSLLFRPNGTFLYVVTGLGYYEKQGVGELSFYTEEHGNYIQSARNIYFMSKKSVSWDLALNRPPVSTEVEQVIFESCTYEIEEDTLKISYISYPADAPVLTSQKYIRKKQLPD